MSPQGPGKYDDQATYVREQTKAQGVIVLVLGGEHGSGFSVQADPMIMFVLPGLLEDIAKEIRASLMEEL